MLEDKINEENIKGSFCWDFLVDIKSGDYLSSWFNREVVDKITRDTTSDGQDRVLATLSLEVVRLQYVQELLRKFVHV